MACFDETSKQLVSETRAPYCLPRAKWLAMATSTDAKACATCFCSPNRYVVRATSKSQNDALK